MRLIIAQPDQTLFDRSVLKVVYEAEDGYRGILSRHIDVLTSLTPGILIAVADEEKRREYLFAVDLGLVVKQEHTIYVATRRGVQGADLASLRQTVENTYRNLNEREARSRGALRLLEGDFLRQFAEMESTNDEFFQ